MRILIDIRHLGQTQKSGIGEYTVQLLRALFPLAARHQFVLFSSGTQKPNVEKQGLLPFEHVTHVHLQKPNKWLNLRTILFQHPTINWFCREPIDLLFLPHINFAVLPNDIPTVLTVHDLSWNIFPEFFSAKMRLWHTLAKPEILMQQARQLISPSTSTAEDLKRLYGIESQKINVIAHGISAEFSSRMQARDHGVRSRLKLPKRFALFVGTLEPRKNLRMLIEAIKQYRTETRDELHLVLSGGLGWHAMRLKHRLKKTDVRGWVHALGYVNDEDRPALYRSATVFVWPSLYEGFGLPPLEAMASGVPVITSGTSSLPEIVGSSGVLIDPFNQHDLVDALKQVLSSMPLQQQLITRGMDRAKQFSWEKTAKETLNVFERAEKQ